MIFQQSIFDYQRVSLIIEAWVMIGFEAASIQMGEHTNSRANSHGVLKLVLRITRELEIELG